MSGETFRMLFFPPLSLGWDSGYSHMRKQSIKNCQYLKGPVLWHLIPSLGLDCWTRCVFTWWCGFETGKHPVVYEGHWLRVLHQWPLGVVERSPAAEAQQWELWLCVPDERFNDPSLGSWWCSLHVSPWASVPLLFFLFSLSRWLVLSHLFCISLQCERNESIFISVSLSLCCLFRSICFPYHPTNPLSLFLSTCRELSCRLSFSLSHLHKLHVQRCHTLSLFLSLYLPASVKLCRFCRPAVSPTFSHSPGLPCSRCVSSPPPMT